ncbi:MAG: hypothetical protein ACJAS3_002185 [Roseivirga sp.]|jgi:hypothetical protein
MLKNLVKYSALLWAFLFCNVLNAQFTHSSYTAFGLGDINWGGYAHNAGMGGLGISNNNALFLNNINPALIASNKEAIFQIDASFDNRIFSNGQTQYSSFTGGFKDFGFSMPIKLGKWNLALGLSPYSSVNYGLIQEEGTIAISDLSGGGGIDQAYITNAIKIGDNLLVGFRASLLFGSISREIEYVVFDSSVAGVASGSTVFNERRSFSDLSANLGLVYKLKINESSRINIGAFYNLGSDARSRNLTKFESRNGSGNILSSDTLINNVDSQIRIPQRIGFGLTYEKIRRVTIGIDFQSQAWGDYINEAGESQVNLGDAFRLAAGGEFTPSVQNTKLASRFTYRLGVHFEKTPYVVNSEMINDFGINFGVSVPLNAFWGVSNLTLGGTVGTRGDVTDGRIRENYFKLNLGFSFQDITWFARQKYN